MGKTRNRAPRLAGRPAGEARPAPRPDHLLHVLRGLLLPGRRSARRIARGRSRNTRLPRGRRPEIRSSASRTARGRSRSARLPRGRRPEIRSARRTARGRCRNVRLPRNRRREIRSSASRTARGRSRNARLPRDRRREIRSSRRRAPARRIREAPSTRCAPPRVVTPAAIRPARLVRRATGPDLATLGRGGRTLR